MAMLRHLLTGLIQAFVNIFTTVSYRQTGQALYFTVILEKDVFDVGVRSSPQPAVLF